MAFLNKTALFTRHAIQQRSGLINLQARTITIKKKPDHPDTPAYELIRAGPYPFTEKERAAAAVKYGLKPEDYQPYPLTGVEWGDYPLLPDRPQTDRDAFYDWDFPEQQRDYGDPVPIDADQRYPWLYQAPYEGENMPISFMTQILTFLSACGFVVFMFNYKRILDACDIKPRATIKQFPYMGEVHYTFKKPGELDEDHH